MSVVLAILNVYNLKKLFREEIYNQVKRFENAEILVISFEMTDVITTSLIGDNAGNGEDDEILYN